MAHRVVRYTRSKGDRFSLWRVRLTSTLGLANPTQRAARHETPPPTAPRAGFFLGGPAQLRQFILGEVMKIDYRTARMRTHRRNIQRYGRLLATELTDLERKYLHRRIAEEQAELERLAQAEH